MGITALDDALFGSAAWSAIQVREELSGPGRYGVVALSADALVGYCCLRVVDQVADLTRIGVHPEHQRRGLAGRLLDRALAGVTAERLLLEVAETNGPALALYTSRGVIRIARRPRYYPDGTAALVLQLML